jgi:hypothetical protein
MSKTSAIIIKTPEQKFYVVYGRFPSSKEELKQFTDWLKTREIEKRFLLEEAVPKQNWRNFKI